MTPPPLTETYAKKRGEFSFNWTKFLEQTEYTDEELQEALKKANSWVTCACGNQCAILPRDFTGMPKDQILRYLGIDFSIAIAGLYEAYFNLNLQDIIFYKRKAAEILVQIEERANELLYFIED